MLAVLMIMTGCQDISEQTWAVKSGDAQINLGVYQMYQIDALQKALFAALDSGKELSGQMINGKEAYEWIKETSRNSVLIAIAAEYRLKELGINWTSEEQFNMEKYANNTWNNVASWLDGNSLTMGTYIDFLYYSGRFDYLLELLYTPLQGLKAIPVEELAAFVSENAVPVNRMVTGMDAADEINEATRIRYRRYAADINANIRTIQQCVDAENAYYSAEGAADHDGHGHETNFDTDSQMTFNDGTSAGAEMTKTVFALKNGEAVVIEGVSALYLVQRDDAIDINAYVKQNQFDILHRYKEQDLFDELMKLAAGFDVKFNDEALKTILPEEINIPVPVQTE